MLKIYKYEVPIESEFSIEMPRISKVLKVENQHDKPMMWAMVETDSPLKTRHFKFVGTGHNIEYDIDDLEWISTFQVEGGNFIFHVFEIKKDVPQSASGGFAAHETEEKEKMKREK